MSFRKTLNYISIPLGSILLLYAVLGFFADSVRITAIGSTDITPRALRLTAAFVAALLLTIGWTWAKRSGEAVWQVSAKWLTVASIGALTLLLLSEYSSQSFIFFQGSHLASDVLVAGVLVVAASLFVRARPAVLNAEVALVTIQIICAVSLIGYLDSRLIFADDHPSFLYRFQLLKDHFPFIPFYNTDWNAGYSGREFFPSGMLNVFLFFWPVVYFLGDIGSADGVNAYNYVILLYVFLVPWASYAAARIFGCSRFAAAIAGVLSLGPSLSYFEWLLRYGTLGFAFSAGMAPLALALAYRLSLAERPPRTVHVLALLVFSFCCISWSLSAIIFVPITVAALLKFRLTFGADRRKFVLAFIVLFVVVNGPWMKVFIRESKVFSFVSGQTMPGSDTRSVQSEKGKKLENAKAGKSFTDVLRKKYRGFKQEIRKINPVILFMFIPGVFMLAGVGPRALMLGTVFWLFFIAIVGDALKPQLELRRMVIPASFLMTIAAGVGIQKTLVWLITRVRDSEFNSRKRAFVALCAVVVSGLLVVSPLSAAAHYTNKRERFYRFAPSYFIEVAEAIKRHGGDGRTMFLGFILHDFGASNYAAQDGGHIAPLAKLSGKELYASDYYHSRWSTVDPIPETYRKRGASGIEEFLDLVNVSAVVTFKREWVKYCKDRPEIYTEVHKGGRFRLFTRNASSAAGYFHRGSGTVRRLKDGFAVTPDSAEVVVKYRYHPRLRAYPDGLAELFPVAAFMEDRGGGKQEQVSFVGIRPRDKDSQAEVRIGFYDRE